MIDIVLIGACGVIWVGWVGATLGTLVFKTVIRRRHIHPVI